MGSMWGPSRGASAPADQPAERTHHLAHWNPHCRRQDENHDRLYRRRARAGRGRQDDHGQGTGTRARVRCSGTPAPRSCLFLGRPLYSWWQPPPPAPPQPHPSLRLTPGEQSIQGEGLTHQQDWAGGWWDSAGGTGGLPGSAVAPTLPPPAASLQVESSQAFTWQSQLRHRWDEDRRHCFANICDAQIQYSYEYLGNTPRLVITPLTDR